ncbi:unnamed protein product [Closterium sp. NIES-54]
MPDLLSPHPFLACVAPLAFPAAHQVEDQDDLSGLQGLGRSNDPHGGGSRSGATDAMGRRIPTRITTFPAADADAPAAPPPPAAPAARATSAVAAAPAAAAVSAPAGASDKASAVATPGKGAEGSSKKEKKEKGKNAQPAAAAATTSVATATAQTAAAATTGGGSKKEGGGSSLKQSCTCILQIFAAAAACCCCLLLLPAAACCCCLLLLPAAAACCYASLLNTNPPLPPSLPFPGQPALSFLPLAAVAHVRSAVAAASPHSGVWGPLIPNSSGACPLCHCCHRCSRGGHQPFSSPSHLVRSSLVSPRPARTVVFGGLSSPAAVAHVLSAAAAVAAPEEVINPMPEDALKERGEV